MRGVGPAPLGFLCTLSAGGFLLLAMRNALADARTAATSARRARLALSSSSMLTMSSASPGESWGRVSSLTSASKVKAPSGPAMGNGPSTLSFGP